MKDDLNELYKEIIEKNINDYKAFLNEYLELIKKYQLGDCDRELDLINDYMIYSNISEKEYNLFHLWLCLEKLHYKNFNSLLKPFLFKFDDSFNTIEDFLTEKAQILYKEFDIFYKNSAFFNTLKSNILNLLMKNKMGLTFGEIAIKIKLNINVKEKDIAMAINELISNNKIVTIKGREPKIYYIVNK